MANEGRRSNGPPAGATTRRLGTPSAVDLGPALADKVTLSNLWTPWCVPCGEEMPVLTAYTERPVSIPALGVNTKESAPARPAFIAEIDAHYSYLFDGGPDETQASSDRLVDAADGRTAWP
jgi:thiol-disulfide isomerase/thioredoxin